MSQLARPLDSRPNEPPLLATKTFVPRTHESLVPRPHLLGRLDDALKRPLTLISAPAGFGKTTLLAEWLRTRSQCACWLSLDAADNNPPRFLSYVIAALQRGVPGLAADLVLLLHSPQPPSAEAVVTTLVNELAAAPDQIVLVLDDYHAVTSAAVNDALTLLLENLPPNVHLVIATRSDPPVPLARLRSRGQVLEVRADDLRFTADEAAAFLGQATGLILSSEQVAALEERTEGWIAGLQMAALSMRGRDDVDGFIRAFAGTNRFILDFLVEEVLSREPAAVQAFLTQTAILTRLTGPLCDAVTGASDGQEMLERLERRNLFVVPLDDDRRWYRYHHLFADLLRARLYQSGSASVARLLVRAAEWCDREGLVSDAVGYALTGRAYELAAGLIARHWTNAVNTGEVETVWSWLNALPQDVVRDSASLGIAYCWVLWLRGQTSAIEPRLADAERALGEMPVPASEEYATAAALLATLRAIVARSQGDFEAARAHAERALALVPAGLPDEDAARLRSVICVAVGAACDGMGELERAVAVYTDLIRLSRLSHNVTGLAGATLWTVSLLGMLGRLRQAEELARESLRFVEEQGMSRLPAAGLLQVVMGGVLLERNELEAAEAHLLRGAELARWSGRLDAVRNAVSARVRLALARGDPDGALAAVEAAESALGESAPPLARAEPLALRTRILLRQGALSEAARCAEELARLAAHESGQMADMATLAAARVLAARNTPAEAVAELTRSLAAAEEAGRLGVALELRILRGLVLARQGDRLAAEADLERALALAEPEGYVRIFVDEGEPLADLLRRLAARPARTSECGAYSAAYLARLLAAFDAPAKTPAHTVQTGAARPVEHPQRPPALVEPLSERERQVLRLMAEGLTNEQIAARLIIALGTVKAHIHNISGKLGAQNRAHAVARAKELELL